MKNIFILSILSLLLFNCEGSRSKNKSNAGALALLLIQGPCTSSSTTAIANPGKVDSASRTNYEVAGCSESNLSSIGFSGQNVVKGLTGTSTNSIISSTGSVLASDDLNVEVTFTLNSDSSYLDIVGRATGLPSALTGTKVRITPTTLSAIGATGETKTLGSGALNTSVSKSMTYCMEFHQEAEAHIIFFPTSCASVTSKGAPYSYDAEVATTFAGRGLGFVLNNATITNFKVGTKIATGGKLQ